MKSILSLIIFLWFSSTVMAQDIAKTWYGTLDIQGTKLKVIFHITEAEGIYTAVMDSPDQGAKGIPTDATTYEGDSLKIEASALNMMYKGQVAPAGNKVTGTFTQNGYSFPLELWENDVKADIVLRPQDPIEMNYYSENFTFFNFEDSIVLAGTLTMPLTTEITHTVILVTGSGPQDRNEELKGINHRPFLVLSDYLTRNGIAVFRYDDRGVGESTGRYSLATIDNFAKDASAAIQFIKSRAELSSTKIGIIGHSEGGMVGPMLADQLDFLVLLGAPGTSIAQLLLSQSRLISEATNVQDSVIEANDNLMREVYSYMIENKDLKDSVLYEDLQGIFINGINNYPESVKSTFGDPKQFAAQQSSGLMTPWFKHFVNFVPFDYLSKVTIPVLALNGTLDLQVPYNENLAAIELALKEAGNTDIELVALEGLNHLFQSAVTGAPSEYGKISETINEAALSAIHEWVIKH